MAGKEDGKGAGSSHPGGDGQRAPPQASDARLNKRKTYMEAIARVLYACKLENFQETELTTLMNLKSMLADKSEKFEKAHVELVTQAGITEQQYDQHSRIYASVSNDIMEAQNIIARQALAVTPRAEPLPENRQPVQVEIKACRQANQIGENSMATCSIGKATRIDSWLQCTRTTKSNQCISFSTCYRH